MGLAHKYRPLRALIDISTATNTTVVSAVANKKIIVVNLALYIASGQTAVWKSGTAAISGAIGPAGYTAADNEAGILECALGQALVLTTTAAAVASGHLTYVLLPGPNDVPGDL